jgi:hypothetical protein
MMTYMVSKYRICILGFLGRWEAKGMAPNSLLALLVGEIHFPQIELPLDPAPCLVL